jgi:methylmalonyl-CoA/ethylmalonyl-CoA epimerase
VTSPDVDRLLARVGPGFFQQAFVVADLEPAQQACVATLGCSTFVTLPPSPLPYTYRGKEAECALTIGFARSGDVQIELIQPVSGEGLHVEFLATHGPGAHHLGFMVDRLDDEVVAAGLEPVMAGRFGTLRFVYLDTWAELGTYVELVEDPDEMMRRLMPWRSEASFEDIVHRARGQG